MKTHKVSPPTQGTLLAYIYDTIIEIYTIFDTKISTRQKRL